MVAKIDSTLTIRPAQLGEAAHLAADWHAAFSGVTDYHGFPRDFSSRQEATEIMEAILRAPYVHSFVADHGSGPLAGAVLWQGEEVAAIGPVFVRPTLQGGTLGRQLMDACIARAEGLGQKSIRLTQSSFNRASMSLYAKLGFEVKEPLVIMQGAPLNVAVPCYSVRQAQMSDLEAMDNLYYQIHCHRRTNAIESSIEHGTAMIAESNGLMEGYMSDSGFGGHAVGISNKSIYALLGAAREFKMSGIMIPIRNAPLFKWCLDHGMRIVAPANLMVKGWYQEPKGAFLPSCLY
jgi:GNAT superfamily N-acetyltransferase